jgi:hypothetical protein
MQDLRPAGPVGRFRWDDDLKELVCMNCGTKLCAVRCGCGRWFQYFRTSGRRRLRCDLCRRLQNAQHQEAFRRRRRDG